VIWGDVSCVLAYIVAKKAYNVIFIDDPTVIEFELKVSCDYWGQNLEEIPDCGIFDSVDINFMNYPVKILRG